MKIPEDKVDGYKKLTDDLSELDKEYYNIRDIIQTNHKAIRNLREDNVRWRVACFKQSEKIHRFYLLGTVHLIITLGLLTWISINLISR